LCLRLFWSFLDRARRDHVGVKEKVELFVGAPLLTQSDSRSFLFF
jgi:hypothetical protein